MLKLAMIFNDGMVLQRNQANPVWGTAEPNQTVKVQFDGQLKEVAADENGAWMVELDAHDVAYDLELQISAGNEVIDIHKVCVGEVWLAGGQSNMEYLLGFEQHFDEVKESERNPWIRFFDYPEVAYEGQLEDYDYKNDGFWRGCTEDDLAYFSAVGYYFAANLQKTLNIPVGIIGCNWGGTPACAWMEKERLGNTKGQIWLDEYEDAVKDLDFDKFREDFLKNPMNDRTNRYEDPMGIKMVKIGLSREEQLQLMATFDETMGDTLLYERRPGGLYETMLKKLVPYGIRGVIWYQGETDGDCHPEAYEEVFSDMIANWRELWQKELPFLFVQLAPFKEWMACKGAPYMFIREAQDKISKTVANTWMTSIGDVGMMWDIHPKNKKPVGERMALLARGHVYGEELLCDAPEIEHIAKTDDQLVMEFKNADGLYIDGSNLNAMNIFDDQNQQIHPVSVEIRENQLHLSGCKNAAKVEFAIGDYYEVNLYNQSNIPAIPFRYEI